ncbi:MULTISPECIES: hypothetical protein [Aliiglaciecola]|uniref:hypothetical protein n=1 Tax=Aliiglaciecola TaxID=1406885 RepID=UPI001C09B911|nr:MULTISPECIES: hypothetical protein [Aliiglaciecola]MBU2877926.1 hypothetical protein [Aliiglaciecola lipolytica]MDO6709290.1 hypothetical protein [Aliiglaciecola sp. 2_MG-2023]MDO6750438.1 hypothetical protein [Aliiglaciecola sp. 1_MG-2023]
MKIKLLKTLLVGCMITLSSSASAAIINFNVDKSEFRIDSLETSGFIIERTSLGLASLGADRNDSAFTGKNGRLMTWDETGSNTSGFTLTTDNSDLFSLQSFQSGNGYVNGRNPVSSVTLNGLLSDGSNISEDFSKTGKINLSGIWDNLVSVEFIAHGLNNRAYWDSIRFERFAAPVSVSAPSTIGIFVLCLFGIMAGNIKRKL